MDKKEYIKQRDILNHKMIEIQREMKNLEEQYINSSDLKRFSVGQLVKVIKRGQCETGFVAGWQINKLYDKVELVIMKRKADGTPSKKQLYYFPEYGDQVLYLFENKNQT